MRKSVKRGVAIYDHTTVPSPIPNWFAAALDQKIQQLVERYQIDRRYLPLFGALVSAANEDIAGDGEGLFANATKRNFSEPLESLFEWCDSLRFSIEQLNEENRKQQAQVNELEGASVLIQVRYLELRSGLRQKLGQLDTIAHELNRRIKIAQKLLAQVLALVNDVGNLTTGLRMGLLDDPIDLNSMLQLLQEAEALHAEHTRLYALLLVEQHGLAQINADGVALYQVIQALQQRLKSFEAVISDCGIDLQVLLLAEEDRALEANPIISHWQSTTQTV